MLSIFVQCDKEFTFGSGLQKAAGLVGLTFNGAAGPAFGQFGEVEGTESCLPGHCGQTAGVAGIELALCAILKFADGSN